MCKHMMAVYLAGFPEEAQWIYNEAIVYQEEKEKRTEELYEKVRQYICKMKLNKLRLNFFLAELNGNSTDF